jgi:hypothetical protein
MTAIALVTPDDDEPIDMTVIEAELRPMPAEQLKFHFFSSFNGAARFIARAAVCVKLLEERGEKLTGMPMIGTFRRIASGQIDPALVWKFVDSPNRQRVERLPLNDQRKLVDKPVVPVVEPQPDGKFTTRMVDLTRAGSDVGKLVIGPDGLRSPEEQMVYIGQQKARPISIKPPEDLAEPLVHSRTIKLTDSELEAIRIQAAIARKTEGEILRRFLIQSGAFKRPKT